MSSVFVREIRAVSNEFFITEKGDSLSLLYTVSPSPFHSLSGFVSTKSAKAVFSFFVAQFSALVHQSADESSEKLLNVNVGQLSPFCV